MNQFRGSGRHNFLRGIHHYTCYMFGNFRHQKPDTRHLIPNIRQQTAEKKHTADKSHQAAHSTQLSSVTSHQSPDTRQQTPDSQFFLINIKI